MKASVKVLFTSLFILLLGMESLKAAPVTMNVSGSLIDTNFAGVSIGDSFSGAFTYDSDPVAATSSDYLLGIDFYLFSGASYGSAGNVGSMTYTTSGIIDVYVADNFPSSYFALIDSSLASLVPDGNYDIFALNAYDSGVFDAFGDPVGSGVDVWAILVGTEAMLSDASLPASPNDLLTSPELIAGVFLLDEYVNGVSTGYAIGEINPVPVPAAVWLFGSGLIALFGISRKSK